MKILYLLNTLVKKNTLSIPKYKSKITFIFVRKYMSKMNFGGINIRVHASIL